MENEQIRSYTEEILRRMYPEALVKGSEGGVSEVDFFLEQSVVTTRHGTETSQRRVIAIISAEWARFAQNFNYRVCSDWFGRQDMMDQAKAALRDRNCPDDAIEDSAKTLVKNELIRRHGREAYDSARDTGAFLVKDADWGEIDSKAKRICDKFHIEPNQLTILMVAGSQNHSPSPQAQGLCHHGHELRFCLVDDLEQTVGSYFYEEDITEIPTMTLNKNPDAPKPGLKELLKAKPVVIGAEKSTPVDAHGLQIIK